MRPDSLSGERRILKVTAWVDGASRGNPGLAGYGVYMKTDSGEAIEISGFLGRTTNNIAEYSGLLEALSTARDEAATELEVFADSELMVKQMNGQYKVRHPNLIPLYERARAMARQFAKFSIRHTLRAGNKNADRLANLAVDRAAGRVLERHRSDAQS